jgi:hypothetical protein
VCVAFTTAPSAHPELKSVLGIVEASYFVGRGHLDLAREAAARVVLPDDLSDPAALGLALLAAPLGIQTSSRLSAVFELTRLRRYAEAATALDAIASHPCRELRLGLGAKTALAHLERGAVDAGLGTLDAALAMPVGETAREHELRDALERAAMLLEPELWTVAALDEPGFALHALKNVDVRDRAVLQVALLAEAPAKETLQQAVGALEALADSRATFARHRLRALELQGNSPAPQVSFEQHALEKLTVLLAELLRAMAEHARESTLVEALSPWEGRDEGFVACARERVTSQLDDELRDALERAKTHTEAKPSPFDAKQIFVEVDAAVRRQLDRLRALGAPSVAVGTSVDAAARCFDDLSLKFHELKGCSEMAVKAVERALELERAEHVRERLLRNRKVMGR